MARACNSLPIPLIHTKHLSVEAEKVGGRPLYKDNPRRCETIEGDGASGLAPWPDDRDGYK